MTQVILDKGHYPGDGTPRLLSGLVQRGIGGKCSDDCVICIMTDLDLQALAIFDSTACRLQAWCKVRALGTSCPDQVGFSTRRACEVWVSGRCRVHGTLGDRGRMVGTVWGRGQIYGEEACQEEICGWSPDDVRDMCPSLGSHSAGAQGQGGFGALALTDLTDSLAQSLLPVHLGHNCRQSCPCLVCN